MFRFTSLVIAGCFGAMVGSQAPEFMQQYKQRLGGAIDELAQVVRHFDNDANAAGMDRASAIERYTQSGDSFFVNRGASMQQTIDRWYDMSDHWRAMTRSNMFSRVPVFISGADSQLLRKTWEAYRPAIPTTVEGFAYSGTGFLISHLIFGSILSLFKGIRRRKPAQSRHVHSNQPQYAHDDRYEFEHYDDYERPPARRPRQT